MLGAARIPVVPAQRRDAAGAAAARPISAMHLAQTRVSFGVDTVDLKRPTAASRRFAAMVWVKDYPRRPRRACSTTCCACRTRWSSPRASASSTAPRRSGRMNLALRRMRASDDDALSLRGDLAQAKDDVAAGRAGVRRASPERPGAGAGARRARRRGGRRAVGVHRHRRDRGARGRQSRAGLLGAVPRQLQGHRAARADLDRQLRRPSPRCHNFPVGQASGNHWGDAITVLETTSGTPYYFNFHDGDLGNFTVIGPSGSGKTVVLSFLLAQAAKFEPAHRLLRQGPRRGDLPARHRRHATACCGPASRPASTRWRCPTRRATGASSRLGRAAARRRPRRRRTASCIADRGRRQLRPAAAVPPPALFPRAAAGTGRPTAGDLAARLGAVARRRRARLAVRQRRSTRSTSTRVRSAST